jgi:dihydroorotate dehydrogenase
MSDAADSGVVAGGVTLPFPVMNAAGSVVTMAELRALGRSRTGAVVLRTATVHPFVHPEFRTLHNPGYDKLVPLVREMAELGERPIIASVAGGTPDEYALLARAFSEAGASAVELDLAEAWVAATLGPFEDDDLATLRDIVTRTVLASASPVWVRLPDLPVPLPYPQVTAILGEAGVSAVVARNDFTGFERLLLESTVPIDVIAMGTWVSGWDVTRALQKGAKAVQVGPTLADGTQVFARLEREMRIARGERPS